MKVPPTLPRGDIRQRLAQYEKTLAGVESQAQEEQENTEEKEEG
jgi:hypothetical protein